MEWSSVPGFGILAFIAAAIGVSGQSRGLASMRGHPGRMGAAGLAAAIGTLTVAAAIAGWIGTLTIAQNRNELSPVLENKVLAGRTQAG